MKKIIILIVVLILAAIVLAFLWKPLEKSSPNTSQNTNEGQMNNTNNSGGEKSNLIVVVSPVVNQTVKSPLVIKGKARGNWFFEASFPIELKDFNGQTVARGIATAQGDWMTTEFVPFEAILTFSVDKNSPSQKGTLILRKDNPSGLPEHDDSLEIPLVFN